MRFSEAATKDVTTRSRRASINAMLTMALCIVAAASVYFAANAGSNGKPMQPSINSPQPSKSPGQQAVLEANGVPQTVTSAITIRKPTGPPSVLTELKDAHGNAVTVSCSTCHATRTPNFANKTVADLDEFHGTLSLAHGKISCLSCHNAEDYDSLKLADGSRIEFTDVMTLCAQCHGNQMRDYEHNAHGGMNGYWDLTKGPRTKNNCVDCHNPHSPQFPKMRPTFKPQDRFLDGQKAAH